MTTLRSLLAACAAAFALLSAVPAAAPPSRLVAVADVHGAGDAFVKVLQRAGLIDARQQWTGGDAVLVQTGDLLDRGTDVKIALDNRDG